MGNVIMREINQAGLDLIKEFEQCRLVTYADQGGLPTAGWGTRVAMPVGTRVSQAWADARLLEMLTVVEHGICADVKVTLSDNQFSALVSLVYNIGLGAFSNSTLLRDLNSNDLSGAAAQFLVWNKVQGLVSEGLVRRRAAEQALFMTL